MGYYFHCSFMALFFSIYWISLNSAFCLTHWFHSAYSWRIYKLWDLSIMLIISTRGFPWKIAQIISSEFIVSSRDKWLPSLTQSELKIKLWQNFKRWLGFDTDFNWYWLLTFFIKYDSVEVLPNFSVDRPWVVLQLMTKNSNLEGYE